MCDSLPPLDAGNSSKMWSTFSGDGFGEMVYWWLLTYDSETSSSLPLSLRRRWKKPLLQCRRHHSGIEHKSWNLDHNLSFQKPWRAVNVISMLFKTLAEHLTRLKEPLSSGVKAPQFGRKYKTEWRWFFIKITICRSNWLEYVFSWEMTLQQWINTKALHRQATSLCCFDQSVNTHRTRMYSLTHSHLHTVHQKRHINRRQ